MDAWRQELKKNFTSLSHLADFLELSSEQRELLLPRSSFGLNLPFRLAEKMAKGSVEDPLFVQFVPLAQELMETPGFSPDPVQDGAFQKTCKLLQKYAGRALLLTTGACAMHCRFCFRQHFPYDGKAGVSAELAAIAEDSSLREVILSGGDPLSLSDRAWVEIVQFLEKEAPHVERLRVHTRFLVGIPERVTPALLDLLGNTCLSVVMVIHINHPKEIDDTVGKALRALQQRGCLMLSQSVLLRGVNDRLEVLQELFETLIRYGTLPYYLHQLDRAQGTGHFEVSEEEGLQWMQQLRERLPGYAVPRYVREIPGEKHKIEL